jgi:hypothetical protein
MFKYSLSLLAILTILNPNAFATDDKTPVAPGEVKPSANGGTAELGESAAETEAQNNRAKTLEGSKSPFSGQFNISYQGSTISHPFSEDAPNPSGATPPPLVTLGGTISARYRIDKRTTMGLGTGITTETPFQGPKNTSVSDPYADIARSYFLGKVHNRADFQFVYNTSDQYRNVYGYRTGFSLVNESSYLFPFGLTAGFLLELDYNLFSGDAAYATATAPHGVLHNQVQWDVITDPFFEYTLSDHVNLRTVIGIQSLNLRDMSSDFALHHPTVYETLGVGIQVLPAWFIYPFVEFFPSQMQSNKTVVGFNTIINLF